MIVSGGSLLAAESRKSRHPAMNRVFVAADAGDYIYPSDVRLDAPNYLLYVSKARGLAGGISKWRGCSNMTLVSDVFCRAFN